MQGVVDVVSQQNRASRVANAGRQHLAGNIPFFFLLEAGAAVSALAFFSFGVGTATSTALESLETPATPTVDSAAGSAGCDCNGDAAAVASGTGDAAGAASGIASGAMATPGVATANGLGLAVSCFAFLPLPAFGVGSALA